MDNSLSLIQIMMEELKKEFSIKKSETNEKIEALD